MPGEDKPEDESVNGGAKAGLDVRADVNADVNADELVNADALNPQKAPQVPMPCPAARAVIPLRPRG